MPDPYADFYKQAIEGKKQQVEKLANNVLTLLSSAKDPNYRQSFKDACSNLHLSVRDLQGIFNPNVSIVPTRILSQFGNAVSQIEKTPEQFQYIIQLVELLPQVRQIPLCELSLEDDVKKLVDDKELQEKIDQLRGELTRLIKECGDHVQYTLMTEIQRLGDVLLGVRKKSLLEVLATSDGIAVTVGAAVDFGTGTPVGTILSTIARIASEIRSSAHDKLDDRLRSYLDDLNVRMPTGKSVFDRSVSRLELPE